MSLIILGFNWELRDPFFSLRRLLSVSSPCAFSGLLGVATDVLGENRVIDHRLEVEGGHLAAKSCLQHEVLLFKG